MNGLSLAFFAAVLGAQTVPPTLDTLRRDLEEVARVAEVMVDGDLCRRIPTARSLVYIAKEHPRDRWFGADNYDVNHAPFIQVKKTLIRLARLTRHTCDVNLWMPVDATPPRIHIVIRNVNELSQFWVWGALTQAMFPEMKRVLDTGERATVVARQPGMVSVLAPVRDSLGDIVGLVEVVGRLETDPSENVK